MPGVSKIGKISYDFPININDLRSKVRHGVKLWKVEYDIETTLNAREGYLLFNLVYKGKKCGSATIEYSSY